MVEQGLMVDSLGLLGNEPVGILRGWCNPRGGAGSLSLCWDQFPWSHWGRSRARVSGDKEDERKSERETKLLCGGEMKIRWGFF